MEDFPSTLIFSFFHLANTRGISVWILKTFLFKTREKEGFFYRQNAYINLRGTPPPTPLNISGVDRKIKQSQSDSEMERTEWVHTPCRYILRLVLGEWLSMLFLQEKIISRIFVSFNQHLSYHQLKAFYLVDLL